MPPRRGRLRPALAALGAGIVLFLPLLCASAAERPPLEYQVKASMIYNFLQFIEWPPDVLGPAVDLNICILGEDRFGAALDALSEELSKGHRIKVRRDPDPAQLSTACHVLFFSESEESETAKIVSSLDGGSVLTIGETDDFTEQGGIIEFVVTDGKLRFEINNEASLKARLKISSKLLRLAIDANP